MKMEKQSIFRTTLSRVLYYMGLVAYYPMLWWDPALWQNLGFLYPVYSKLMGWIIYPVYSRLMGWSVNLDKAGKVWLYVEEG
ncbi:hypothetical protein LCGC14_2733600 [marine sediment metagenome]|uniref:Uncharacterized protein n=1 Tax=marine sediment metagenome TaxID=412755 RepID=A0A0F8ZTX2_9ZZZZ